MSHIFISYSHQDGDYARKLEGELKRRGFEVWIDERIDYGTRWPQVIEDHVDTCAALIVILTPHSKDSDWVQNELARAKRKGKPVFPLLLDGDLWLAIEATQCVDVRDGRLPPPAFYDRLRQVVPEPVRSTPSPPTPKTAVRSQATTARPTPGSRPLWVWVLGSVLVLAVLGWAFWGIRAALQSWAAPTKTPAITSTVQLPISTSVPTATPPSTSMPTVTSTSTSVPAVTSTSTSVPTVTSTSTSVPTARPTSTSVPTVTSTPTPEAGATRIREQDKAVMVYVPAGEFWMGSAEGDADAYSNEFPQHEVYLDAFWIDRTEVTNDQYAQCEQAGVCRAPEDVQDYSDPAYADHPVVEVSWPDAQTFCEWAGGRLPTEAEWEKAARGTDGRLYPWGSDPPTCERAQYWECEPSGTRPVGSTSPAGDSFYGATDMAGNAWEWVADWYGSYPAGLQENPTGPEQGDYRVLRGGGWNLDPASLRAAYRYLGAPDSRYVLIGFRCCVVARQE